MVSVKDILPWSMASMTKSSVITLVIDAQALTSWEFFSNNTFPVDASISTALGAVRSSSESAPAVTGRTDAASKAPSPRHKALFQNFIPHLQQVFFWFILM